MKNQQYLDVVAQDFLGLKLDHFDVDTQRKIRNRQLKLTDDTLRIRKEITNAGGVNNRVPLLDISESRLEGVRDFDKAALPKGVYAVLKRLIIRVAQAATSGNPTVSTVKYTSIITNAPAALLNARIHVRQDNQLLVDIPVADCMMEALNQGAMGDAGYELENKALIAPERPISVDLVFGSAISSGTNSDFIEVAFKVSKTLEK